ncbi:hypothetical protein AB0M22_34605 [Nocardia sp. NPDC051756]|uniref:hypothetical protein n=1 Tax=Nocardia sp. NPDC051756 TaxID=3154751 RepID=UPI00342A886E
MWIVVGVLVVVLVLGLGVVIGISVPDRDGSGKPAAVVPSAAAPSTAAATTSPLPEIAPGIYSMDAIADACDLVDPAPLTKWSSTPKEAPQHHETRPADDGIGLLSCAIRYISTSPVDNVTTNEAGISVQVEFTNAGVAPTYDKWRQQDTAAAGAGRGSGDVTGIGAQGYWRSAVGDSSVSNGTTYIVGVQDSNVSVRVTVAVLRAKGEPTVGVDELDSITRSQVRLALDGLRKK